MKKIISSLMILMMLFQNVAFSATTYYVRTDGGTGTQCTGLADSPYSGSGSNQPCGWKHPYTALGSECANLGATCTTAGKMVGGDTLIIGPGEYMIGYDPVNIIPGSSTSWTYDATMGNVPSGPDAAHPTRILGKGWDTLTGTKPQLWGTERVASVLNVNGNNIEVQWLDVTDHSSCGSNQPAGKTIDGFPSQCQRSTYPYGPHGDIGIMWSGSNLLFRYVSVYGMGTYGWETPTTSTFGSNTFDHIVANGNPFGGWDTGQQTNGTGTTTFLNPTVEWNGCQAHYPLVSPDLSSPSNYTNCAGQGQVGNAADGISFGAAGQLAGGNWVIIGPASLSFNMGDGFDTLHGPGGIGYFSRIKAEGNGGAQMKPNGTTVYVEHSQLLGDCGWWKFSGMQATTCGTAGANGANGASCPPVVGVDYCRANGDVLSLFVSGGSLAYLYNNTIVSNGNVAVLTGAGGVCDSSTRVYGRNNIFLGGRVFAQDTAYNASGQNSTTDAFYNSGATGNGDGPCGSVVWDSDYSIYIGTKNNNEDCTGAHDKCNVSPGFVGSIPMGPTTYYTGTNMTSLVYLTPSSQAVNTGISNLTYHSGTNDSNNFPRTSPYDMGALELGSSPITTCSQDNNSCENSAQCCSGTCFAMTCVSTSPSLPTTRTFNGGLRGNLGR